MLQIQLSREATSVYNPSPLIYAVMHYHVIGCVVNTIGHGQTIAARITTSLLDETLEG